MKAVVSKNVSESSLGINVEGAYPNRYLRSDERVRVIKGESTYPERRKGVMML